MAMRYFLGFAFLIVVSGYVLSLLSSPSPATPTNCWPGTKLNQVLTKDAMPITDTVTDGDNHAWYVLFPHNVMKVIVFHTDTSTVCIEFESHDAVFNEHAVNTLWAAGRAKRGGIEN